MNQSPIITLVEYATCKLDSSELSDLEAEYLYQHFRSQVAIDPPSFKTNYKWQLTSLGWVGFIPFSSRRGISLKPKVPLKNLFKMLEYAYDLKSFKLLSGLYECESIRDLYENLALILAGRFMKKAREGLYKSYRDQYEELNCIRGRIDVAALSKAYGNASVMCTYEDQTIDNEDNQIIAWTLHSILQSGLLSERSILLLRKADRMLRNTVTLKHFTASECRNRIYNRLNLDYEVLHKLCSFFLENSGPTQNYGDHAMIPFLINMARLFELFVGRWLEHNIDKNRFSLKRKEPINVDTSNKLRLEMDMVLCEVHSNKTLCVLDTKYKNSSCVDPKDYFQVCTYAENIGCHESVLIYPMNLQNPLDVRPRNIRVRGLIFDIGQDIESSGSEFMKYINAFYNL